MVFDRSNGINWGVIAALVGLALIGASEPPKQPAKAEKAKPAKPEPDRPPPAPLDASKAASSIDTAKDESPCGPHWYGSNDDLCAQWKAADSAAEAAKWAYWQMWLSLMGVIGLVFTLWFNFRALIIAEKATEETKDALSIARRSADSAADLVRISDRNAHLELRAYLEFDSVMLLPWPEHDDPHDSQQKGIRAVISIKNHGRTPASYVNFYSSLKASIQYTGKIYEIGTDDKSDVDNIAPSDLFIIRKHWRMPDYILHQFLVKGMYLVYSLKLDYKDIFEMPHGVGADFEIRAFDEECASVEGTRFST